tara:strand:- start:266 stop:520 length:255 start_codon:yes stop_codon:yes gene_type:complete
MDSDTMKYNIDIAKYTIKIKKLNTEDINNYVDTHKPYYSSAAFRYEVAKDFLIKEFNDKEDDISGLIGLPLKKLTNILKNYNVL